LKRTKTSMSRAALSRAKADIPLWHSLLEETFLNRGRGPSRSRKARRRETLTGGRDSLGFGWEGMAESSLVVHHDSVLLPNFHPRSNRLLRRTHIGIRSDRVGAAYWIAVLFSDQFSCRSRRGKCIAQPSEDSVASPFFQATAGSGMR
jgi:hypothetical protein